VVAQERNLADRRRLFCQGGLGEHARHGTLSFSSFHRPGLASGAKRSVGRRGRSGRAAESNRSPFRLRFARRHFENRQICNGDRKKRTSKYASARDSPNVSGGGMNAKWPSTGRRLLASRRSVTFYGHVTIHGHRNRRAGPINQNARKAFYIHLAMRQNQSPP